MKIPPRVFLADDDADDRELFIDALHNIDDTIICYTATDGKEAIDFLKDTKNEVPDFIFLDLRMPKISGKKCLQEIKNEERLKHIPVIIYTTSTEVEDAKDLVKLGASHFVSKPEDPEEIYYLLSMVLTENWAT